MDIKVSQCFVTVRDHEEALAFYRDVLGLEVRNDVQFEMLRWVTLTPSAQPEMEIILVSPAANPNASPQDRKATEELLAKGLLNGLNFTTEDCDATFERIKAAGADVLDEPADQFYGVRDCAFRDPSGNMLRFSQPLRR
jgi:catechol 2,3-dioxygenase-like lactoylglutathione lyase family enzyme